MRLDISVDFAAQHSMEWRYGTRLMRYRAVMADELWIFLLLLFTKQDVLY